MVFVSIPFILVFFAGACCAKWPPSLSDPLAAGGRRLTIPMNRLDERPNGNGTAGICNVLSYGAVGDGIADDTMAIQAAFGACSSLDNGGMIYLPAGKYVITSTIHIDRNPPGLSIGGVGWESMLLWGSNTDLFSWDNIDAAHLNFHDFAVISVSTIKNEDLVAFRFSLSVTQSVFSRILFYGSGSLSGYEVTFIPGAFDLGAVTDTVSLTDCVVWFGVGTLVRVGHGSEVRVQGGRLIGDGSRERGVGVHVTGNNGGVHIVDTDVIGLYEGKSGSN